MLAGQVPDPVRAVAQDGELPDIAGAADAGLGGHQLPEPGGGLEGGQVGGRARVADRVAVLVDPGLGEHARELDLAGPGPAVLALAVPAFGLGGHHRHAGAVDGDVHLVRQVRGRQREDRAGGDGGGPRRDHRGGRGAVALGVPLDPPGADLDPGQVSEQPAARGERLGGGGPGGHLRQPPRHRVPGHPKLTIPRGQAMAAHRAAIPGPAHRDRAEHRVESLVPVGHELREVPGPAGNPQAAVAAVSGQQARQQRAAYLDHRRADRQLRRLQSRPAGRAAQRPGGGCGQLLYLGRELCRDLRAQLL